MEFLQYGKGGWKRQGRDFAPLVGTQEVYWGDKSG